MPFESQLYTVGDCGQTDLAAIQDSVNQVLLSVADRAALHAYIDGVPHLATTLWKRSTELGWTAASIDEAYGGLGLGWTGAAAILLELGRWLAPGPFISAVAAAYTIGHAGDETMRETWLPRLAEGAVIATPANLSARGPRQRLLGSPDARLALAWDGAGQLALFELPQALPQVEIWDRTRHLVEHDTAGQTPLATFPDPAAAAEALENATALGVACDSIGGAAGIADQTLAYMKARNQFGQPIAAFQALKHRMADMAALHEVRRHLLGQAVEAADSGEDMAFWARMAKAEASEAFAHIAAECLQLHGGIGFTWEYDCHLFLKRARMNEALVGSNGPLRDAAAEHLARITTVGRTTLELRAI